MESCVWEESRRGRLAEKEEWKGGHDANEARQSAKTVGESLHLQDHRDGLTLQGRVPFLRSCFFGCGGFCFDSSFWLGTTDVA